MDVNHESNLGVRPSRPEEPAFKKNSLLNTFSLIFEGLVWENLVLGGKILQWNFTKFLLYVCFFLKKVNPPKIWAKTTIFTIVLYLWLIAGGNLAKFSSQDWWWRRLLGRSY